MRTDDLVLVTERPDKARQLIMDADIRDRAGYVSVGNAVASAKELTLCLIKAYLYRQMQKEGLELPAEERGDSGYLQPLIGTAVEKILFEHPGERVELVTPYGIVSGRIDADGGEDGPIECKVTWASSNKDLLDNGQYIEQVAAYALSSGTNKASLVVTHVMGNRGKDSRPKIIYHDLEFSDSELAAWTMELRRRLALVLGDVQPSFDEHYSWECGYCQFKAQGVCPGAPGKKYGFFDLKDRTISMNSGGRYGKE